MYLIPILDTYLEFFKGLGIQQNLDPDSCGFCFCGVLKKKMSLRRNFMNPIVLEIKNYIVSVPTKKTKRRDKKA